MRGRINNSMHRLGAPRRQTSKGLATAVFLGVAGVSPAAMSPAFAQSYSFSNVVVTGNERVDAATIAAYAGIKPGQAVSAGGLNDAYQRIFASGLFESVDLTPQGNSLKVTVKEYPFINVINFEGNKALKDDALADLVKSRSRRIYSPAQAEQDAASIAEMYRVRGRMAATVEPKIIRRDGNRVDLVFEITEGKVVEVERLSFVGNRAFSDRRLRQVLETKQAGLLRQIIQRDTFVAERLEVDRRVLTDFYRSRGYIDFQVLDASAEVSRERDATFVTFTIREGQSYDIGAVTTVSEIQGVNAADFAAVQKIKTGETWSPALIDNNIARMETLALRKGLNFVRVEPRITRDNANQRVNVEFAIVRGERVFVERIDIEGNATTLDHVIRREFRSAEGDPFNPREIRQSAERIRALGYFSNAEVNAEQGSAPDQVIVNVDVEEQPTGSLGFGVSYGVSAGMGFNIGFSESNFLGRGQQIGLSISTTSDNQDTSITFTEPGLLGRDLSLSVGAYHRTSDGDYAYYNTRNTGFDFGLGFPLTEEGRLTLRYSISEDKLYNLNSSSSDLLQREAQAGKGGSLLSSALGYDFSYDNRITGLNPDGGVLLRFGQEFGGLGGDRKYVETTAFAMAERRIMQGDVTLRAIAEASHLQSMGAQNSRVTDRFFARSAIRGFEPNGIGPRDLASPNKDALGGNTLAALRFEAEFPVGLPEEYGILGGAFLDVGSVWGLDDTNGGFAGTTAIIDDGMKPRVSAGVSILWDTPMGPLRFNFSRALVKEDYDREQNFDLTIQTKF